MRLGLTLAMGAGIDTALVLEAERLGYSAVWCGESYGSDAVSPIAWVLARTSRIKAGTGIMQMPARTPACAAMTAMTLQLLSEDRFLCGIGPSGPQVVEGWHGQPYGTPLGRTREYISIIRAIVSREKPLEHHGEHYRIPYDGPDATGLGKPLKSILHGRPLRIYCASITPGGMRLAGEIGDGVMLWLCNPDYIRDVVIPEVTRGRERAGLGLEGFDVVAWAGVVGPAGLPPEVVAGVNADFRRVWDRPETVRRLAGIGFEAKTSTPEAFGAFIRDEIARWAEVVQVSGARAD